METQRHRPRTVAEELDACREYRDFSRKMLGLLHEFLTIEGLVDYWQMFAIARATGAPYTPVYGQGPKCKEERQVLQGKPMNQDAEDFAVAYADMPLPGNHADVLRWYAHYFETICAALDNSIAEDYARRDEDEEPKGFV